MIELLQLGLGYSLLRGNGGLDFLLHSYGLTGGRDGEFRRRVHLRDLLCFSPRQFRHDSSAELLESLQLQVDAFNIVL